MAKVYCGNCRNLIYGLFTFSPRCREYKGQKRWEMRLAQFKNHDNECEEYEPLPELTIMQKIKKGLGIEWEK